MKKIEIEGIAITEGLSRNKVMYLSEELHKFADTMAGRPILKDHHNSTDNVIGKITSAESIDNGKKVKYTGWIKEDGSGIIDRISDGRITEVSIGAEAKRLVKEKSDSDFVIAKDMTCLEMSTTPVPGVTTTSLRKKESSNIDDIESFDDEIKEFTPPASGNLSPKKKNILSKTYSACRLKWVKDHPKDKENKKNKEMCAKIAWGAVNKSENINNVQPLEKSKDDISNNCKEVLKMESEEIKNEEVTKTEPSDEVKKEESETKAEEPAKEVEAKEESSAEESLKKEISQLKEALRQDAITAYKKLCSEKKVEALDVSNASIDTIKSLSLQTEKFSTSKPVEKKEVAVSKSVDVVSEKKSEDKFSDYVIESSELGGYAFYKNE